MQLILSGVQNIIMSETMTMANMRRNYFQLKKDMHKFITDFG